MVQAENKTLPHDDSDQSMWISEKMAAQQCLTKTSYFFNEYRFDIGVESSTSRGLQLKKLNIIILYQLKKPMKWRKYLGSEVDIRSFFKKPRIN